MTTETERILRGPIAWEAIADQIRSGTTPTGQFETQCFTRLSNVLQYRSVNGRRHASDLDLAILVRQVLRFYSLQTKLPSAARLWVPSTDEWPDENLWEKVGINASSESGGLSLRANPWNPNWINDPDGLGVDTGSMRQGQGRLTDTIPADPFVTEVVKFENYRTQGQRQAVRSALLTPPGSTLLVSLPTGDGKSLIFQLASQLDHGDGTPGITLVVTPTVALALDQERSAKELGLANHTLAYTGGMPEEEKRGIIDRIRSGTQRLCFVAPESACGRLRPALFAAATAGLLRTIVLDEAHLVDSWGVNFRNEFQVFSGMCTELIQVSPPLFRPRILLLSATLTRATVTTLKTLFPGDPSNPQPFGLVSATQLRPELQYWVSDPTDADERNRRVMEALLHMPRPAIVYVTSVDHAIDLHGSLRRLGYKRIGLMTGRSSNQDRINLVTEWRNANIDLVVGTSAFGLGVDNPHVRTVIHACIPETLDRFYQEVGRGGRDGSHSASIIIPWEENDDTIKDDRDLAEDLNRRRLLLINTAYRRWVGMFENEDKVSEGDGVFKLRVDRSPSAQARYIDMVGERNTEWNVRTLTLMASSRMISLLGPENHINRNDASNTRGVSDINAESEDLIEIERFQRIKILEPAHMAKEIWEELVGPHRNRMNRSNRENLNRMYQFLDKTECSSTTLSGVYELDLEPNHSGRSRPLRVAIACGGCPYCRQHSRTLTTEKASITTFPWEYDRPIQQPAYGLLDAGNTTVIFYGNEYITSDRLQRRWKRALARLAICGVRNLVTLPNSPIQAAEIHAQGLGVLIFTSDLLPPIDFLPAGPVAVIVPPNTELTAPLFKVRPSPESRFIFIHDEAQDPDIPGIPFRDRLRGAQMDLSLFMSRML